MAANQTALMLLRIGMWWVLCIGAIVLIERDRKRHPGSTYVSSSVLAYNARKAGNYRLAAHIQEYGELPKKGTEIGRSSTSDSSPGRRANTMRIVVREEIVQEILARVDANEGVQQWIDRALVACLGLSVMTSLSRKASERARRRGGRTLNFQGWKQASEGGCLCPCIIPRATGGQ